MVRLVHRLVLCVIVLAFAGCAAPGVTKYDYSRFRSDNPRSILIVPVVNRSIDVDAPDYFLSSISVPIAERGYYVFPVNLVKRVMADDGLYDADMVHANDPVMLAGLFGADSVLYISIERWDAQYALLATVVTVQLSYQLKSGKTGDVLWNNNQTITYSPQPSSSGNPLVDLIASAVVAAVQKAAPNYMPLARQANARATYQPGHGMPAGPYDIQYQKDIEAF